VPESYQEPLEGLPQDETIQPSYSLHPERFSGLSNYLLYPDDSELATFIQGRAEFLASDKPVVTQVVHSAKPVIFATGDLIVISDGAIGMFDTREEIDAIVAHELTHNHEEHVADSKQHTDEDEIAKIGRARAHETRADFGEYELLDEKGINVAGIPRSFRKIKEYQASQPRNQKRTSEIDIIVEDYEHGTATDRAINAEELLRILDVQNARVGDLTPLSFSATAMEEYVSEASVIEEARRSNNPHLLRYVVERQCSPHIETDAYIPIDERIQLHSKALQLSHPGLDQQQAYDLSMLAITVAYGRRLPKLHYKPTENYNLPKDDGLTKVDHYISPSNKILDEKVLAWAKSIDSYDKVAAIFGNEAQTRLTALGVRLNPLKREILTTDCVETALTTEADFNVSGVRKLIEELQPSKSLHNSLTQAVIESGIAAKPDTQLTPELIDFIASGYLPGAFVSTDKSADGRMIRLSTLVNQRRVEIVQSFGDLIELDKFLHTKDTGSSLPSDQWLQDTSTLTREQLAELRHGAERGLYLNRLNKEDDDDYVDPLDTINKRPHPAIEHAYASVLATISAREFRLQLDKALAKRHIDSADASRLALAFFRTMSRDGVYILDEDPELRGPITDRRLLNSQLKLLAYIDNPKVIRQTIEAGSGYFENSTAEILRIANLIIAEQANRRGEENAFTAFKLSDLSGIPVLNKAWQSDMKQVKTYADVRDLAASVANLPIQIILESASKDKPSGIYNSLIHIILQVPEDDRDVDWYFTVAILANRSADSRVRLDVPPAALLQACELLTFDEAFELLDQKTPFLPDISKRLAWEYLSEHKAETIGQLEMISDIIKKDVQAFLSDSSTLGRLAIADNIILPNYVDASFEREGGRRPLPAHENLKTLEMMLLSGEDDSKIAEYVFERWLYTQTFSSDKRVTEYFNFSDYRFLHHRGKEKKLQQWTDLLPRTGLYETFEVTLDQTFMVGAAAKYYMIRKLLVGNDGILLSGSSKRQLIGLVESTMLNTDQGEGIGIFRDITGGLTDTATSDELYSLIAPVLTDLALRYPTQRKRMEELATTEAGRLLREYRILHDGLDPQVAQNHIDTVSRKLLGLMLGRLPSANNEAAHSNQRPTNLQLLELFSTDRAIGAKRMSPAVFARTIGMQSGALGVRMLQLAGQYFELPAADAAVFDDAYDNVRGQTRIQALRVLQREAKTHPETAEIMDNITTFGGRIGGGSLMTVYDVTLKDGRRMALSVKNPNVEYNLDKMSAILKKSIQHVSTSYPDSTVYPTLGAIMGQVHRWIHDELEDPTFELKDARFRLQNDEKLYDHGGALSIHVPQTMPTGTRRVRCEEYVAGHNLQGLVIAGNETDIANGRITQSDYRKITTKMAHNYVEQLFVHGLAHSDIHPGNFRVMGNNLAIAIFDRYNLLEINKDEQVFIVNLAGSLMQGDTARATHELLEYLQAQPENAGKQHAIQKLTADLSASAAQGVGGLLTMLTTIQQSSVSLPLKFSLIARNFSTLDKMAVKAGFSGLGEALAG